MMSMKFIIFLGKHQHLDFFTNEFMKYLQKCSIDYYVVDIRVPETCRSSEFVKYFSQKDTVVFSFNNVGIRMENGEGINLWKERNIPVIDWIVDHPRYFADSMLDPPCDLYVFALDEEHKDYIERFYPKVRDVCFAPNGGTELYGSIAYRDRQSDVIYMGNCGRKIDSFPIPQKESGIEDSAVFYKGIIQEMFDNPMLSVESAMEIWLNRNGIELSNEQILILSTECAPSIEFFVRRNYKLEGMKALDEAGIRVDVYGLDWEDDNYSFSENITLHGRVSPEEVLEKLCDSKISVCFMPWFKKGCSEKNLDSMLNGAVCVTDRSSYLEKYYRDGDNIVFFDLNNLAQMSSDVKWLLENPESAEKIAQKGYETARLNDTWSARFDKLIDYAQYLIRERI